MSECCYDEANGGEHLGARALEKGYSVRSSTLPAALADLLRQESLPATERRLKRYTSPRLLILDGCRSQIALRRKDFSRGLLGLRVVSSCRDRLRCEAELPLLGEEVLEVIPLVVDENAA